MVLSEVLNPFARNSPTGPVDPPTTWLLLAAARRERTSGPITVSGTVGIANGLTVDQTDVLDLATFTSNPAQTIEQDLIDLINAPSLALTGRPLIGNGANGAPGTGKTARPADGCWATAALAAPARPAPGGRR